MATESNTLIRIITLVSVAFGAIALPLACVGIGTPNWQSTCQYASGRAQVSSTDNFFSNGSVRECLKRDENLYYYDSPFTGIYTAANDTNARLQNAAGLSIVGIIFFALGTVSTLMTAIIAVSAWVTSILPILLFLACLFMLAGLAEGARVIVFNDYAANLYVTAHLLTILSFGICALAAGRFHFERLR